MLLLHYALLCVTFLIGQTSGGPNVATYRDANAVPRLNERLQAGCDVRQLSFADEEAQFQEKVDNVHRNHGCSLTLPIG